MRIKVDSFSYETGLIGRTSGKKYDAWVLKGTKLGFDGPDEEGYSKVFFDNTACAVYEKGVRRENVSAVGFIQNMVKEGDVVEIKHIKSGRGWTLDSIRNTTTDKPVYTPLSDEELAMLQQQQHDAQAVQNNTAREFNNQIQPNGNIGYKNQYMPPQGQPQQQMPAYIDPQQINHMPVQQAPQSAYGQMDDVPF